MVVVIVVVVVVVVVPVVRYQHIVREFILRIHLRRSTHTQGQSQWHAELPVRESRVIGMRTQGESTRLWRTAARWVESCLVCWQQRCIAMTRAAGVRSRNSKGWGALLAHFCRSRE